MAGGVLEPVPIFTPALPTRQDEVMRCQHEDWVFSITYSATSRFGDAWLFHLGDDQWTPVSLH